MTHVCERMISNGETGPGVCVRNVVLIPDSQLMKRSSSTNSSANSYHLIPLGEAGLKSLGSNPCSVWEGSSKSSSPRLNGAGWGNIQMVTAALLGALDGPRTHLESLGSPPMLPACRTLRPSPYLRLTPWTIPLRCRAAADGQQVDHELATCSGAPVGALGSLASTDSK